ncbi:MAG TPA: AbrB/MazE/SpoVT family DNA-binding domain-containing protein [Vicinamibacterales bacterium]|nr:AbrB/MazE/SpoVT family DNA-binding domain-containing protein [Vicinamibacterales bacterium]
MAGDEIKRERSGRVRESSPEYGASAPSAQPQAYAVTMADRGRLVLPAGVRDRLDIHEGDRMTLWVDPDGTMRLQTASVYARSLLGMFKHLSPERHAVDELIAERRREAAMEERDTRALARRHGRKRGK